MALINNRSAHDDSRGGFINIGGQMVNLERLGRV
jgi:hypothetical protein